MSNAAGRNEEATGLIDCFQEGLLGLFDSFSKVFVVVVAAVESPQAPGNDSQQR